MILAITAKSPEREAGVEPRFGRAPYFHIVNTETEKFEVVENTQNVNAVQGAGIQSAEAVVSKKVEVLLTGHCGPKAFQVLNAAGIKIVIGVEGKVKDAIEQFKNNEFEYAVSPDVEPHW